MSLKVALARRSNLAPPAIPSLLKNSDGVMTVKDIERVIDLLNTAREERPLRCRTIIETI